MTWWRWKITPLKGILLALVMGSVGAALYRLLAGLGASTNLSDTTPWGLWKAVDVMIVVPLGASGFTMAFVRYFLKAEKYEYIMRRSVIWAAVAYLSMGVRLAFDIGLPWRLPYPLIFWGNLHSPLFEVAWCVFIYLIVLFFENVPRLFERFEARWVAKVNHAIHSFAPIFVLVGVLLSTMHQSSLGTLYMITGKRMDPLWYHPWLNYIYLLTAIATGLAVAILIEGWSSLYYQIPFQTRELTRLAIGAAVALFLALVWRLGSLVAEGQIGQIFRPRFEMVLWWVEMLVGYVVPIGLIAVRRVRASRWGLVLAAAGTVAGMILLRLNVVFTGMAKALGSHYVPSWTEILFTLGATAGTMVIYTWFVETLPTIQGETLARHGSAAD